MQQIGLDASLNNLPDFLRDINKMNAAIDSFAKNGKDAGTGFEKGFGEIVIGGLRQVGTLAVDALLKAGQAVAGFVKDSIGLAGTFEANMLQFQSVAGKGVDTKGLEEFRDLFLDIGKRLPVSTSEVQLAAIEMVKGGIDPATIAAGGLEQNIQFAAAAMGGDLVKAAEISSKIMGGWAGVGATAAEKADFLTHATDLLARAANASATDVEGLSRGVFNAQGIARAAGVSFDDLTTTLAELAPRFASSSEAGNSLKNMIARLQPTTKTAAGYMLDLGLITEEGGNKFYDAQGKFVGFQQTSELLKEALVGLTEQQKTLYLQQIFGNDAMGSASALAELGAAGYQEMADALENANGVQAAAALTQQGFNVSLDNVKGSVEALQITIGSALLPVLSDLMDNVIAPAVNTLTDMAAALGGNEEAFARLSPAAQGIVTTLATLSDDVSAIVGAFNDAGAGSDEFAQSLDTLGTNLGVPGGLIKDVVSGVQDLVKWFGTADDKTSDLGSGVEDLNGIWKKAQDVINDVVNGYMVIIGATLPIVSKFIDEHGEEIDAFFKTTWDSIIDIVNIALDIYDAIVPPILQAVATFIDDHASEIQKVLTGAWDMISSLISGTLDIIKGIFTTALALINGDWEGAWNGIVGIAESVGKTVEGVVTGFLNIIAGFFDTSVSDILATWEHNWNTLVDIATKTDWAQVGQDVVDGIKQGLIDNWNRLTSWVSEKISGLVDAALEAIGAGSPATEFMPVGQFAVQGIMVGFQNMMPRLMDLVSELGDDLVSQAADIASQVQDAIGDAFGATASVNRQKIKNLEKFADVAERLKGGVQFQLQDAEKVAQGITDPKQAAAWFKQRSDQIFELADITSALDRDLTDQQARGFESSLKQYELDLDALGKEDEDTTQEAAEREHIMTRMAEAQSRLNDDLTDSARQMLIDKYQLVNAAQNAETAQFQANQTAQGNPLQDIIDQMRQLLNNKDIPGILESPVVNALNTLLGQLISPPSTRPPTTGGATSSYSQSTTLNMPIYSNNSPSAMQDSMAIAAAALL